LYQEEDILGSLLVHGKPAFRIVSPSIEPSDFRGCLRPIADAVWKLHESSQHVDSIAVIDEMRASGTLGRVPEEEVTVSGLIGGQRPISALRSMVERFSRTLATEGATRELREKLLDGDLEEALSSGDLRGSIQRWSKKASSGKSFMVGRSFREMAEIRADTIGADDPGLSTGFKSLDFYLDGLRRGEMTLLAARTGVGKSTLAMNIAVNVAKQGARVLFFNVEMKDMALFDRSLASEAGVNMQKSRKGELSKEEYARLPEKLLFLRGLPIRIIEASGITPEEFPATIAAGEDLGLVVVDYIQALRVPPKLWDKSRHYQVGRASWTLKHLVALEMNLPVLGVCQLRRPSGEYRHAHPDLSDLRESGDLEQDADNVIFISHRRVKEHSDHRTILIAKNRTGRCGKVDMRFVERFNRFEDIYASFSIREEEDNLPPVF
jgi:replicative DNA helicase